MEEVYRRTRKTKNKTTYKFHQVQWTHLFCLSKVIHVWPNASPYTASSLSHLPHGKTRVLT